MPCSRLEGEEREKRGVGGNLTGCVRRRTTSSESSVEVRSVWGSLFRLARGTVQRVKGQRSFHPIPPSPRPGDVPGHRPPGTSQGGMGTVVQHLRSMEKPVLCPQPRWHHVCSQAELQAPCSPLPSGIWRQNKTFPNITKFKTNPPR